MPGVQLTPLKPIIHVQQYFHNDKRNNTSGRQSEHPRQRDIFHQTPLDLAKTAYEADSNDGAHLTVGTADWEAENGAGLDHQNRHHACREPGGRHHFTNIAADRLYAAFSENEETDAHEETAVGEEPGV